MLIRRLKRIFRADRRALIVALDHGLTEGPARGLENPARVLAKIQEGGADAILTSYGVALRFEPEIASLGLILRLDLGGTKLGRMGPGAQAFQVEQALRVGADAVAVSAFPGTPEEAENLRMLARIIGEAHRWGLPVMAEMQPGGFDAGPGFFTTENVAVSARIAAELGADWVKVPYTPEFGRVVESCYVPVVILGGAKASQEDAVLAAAQGAIAAGAAGIAIGRNIFQADDPAAATRALARIVHPAGR